MIHVPRWIVLAAGCLMESAVVLVVEVLVSNICQSSLHGQMHALCAAAWLAARNAEALVTFE